MITKMQIKCNSHLDVSGSYVHNLFISSYFHLCMLSYCESMWLNDMLPKLPTDSFHQMIKTAHKIKDINNCTFCITDDTETLLRSQRIVSIFAVNCIFPPFLNWQERKNCKVWAELPDWICIITLHLICVRKFCDIVNCKNHCTVPFIHCPQAYSITETGVSCSINSSLSTEIGWSSSVDK